MKTYIYVGSQLRDEVILPDADAAQAIMKAGHFTLESKDGKIIFVIYRFKFAIIKDGKFYIYV